MKRIGKGRKILFAAVLMVAGLLALEGLARVWVLLKGLRQSPSAVQSEFQEILSGLTERVPMPEDQKEDATSIDPDTIYLHPYYGMDTRSGMRSPEIYQRVFGRPRPESKYYVLVVGGSVAARFVEYSWDFFAKELCKDPRFEGMDIVPVPFARGGFKQPQQTGIVAYLLNAGIRPDAVMNIDGFNEAALSYYNASKDVFPLYPSVPHWGFLIHSQNGSEETLEPLFEMWQSRQGVEKIVDRCMKYRFYYSAFLSRLALVFIHRLKAEYVDAFNRYNQVILTRQNQETLETLHGPGFPPIEDQVRKMIIDCWIEGSDSIQAMCDARGIYYLHVLQPTLHDVGSKPLTEDEVRMGTLDPVWVRGVHECYGPMRERGRELTARGVNFHDLSMVFADLRETIYFDGCHFSGVGNEIFGQDVAKAFLESLPETSKPAK